MGDRREIPARDMVCYTMLLCVLHSVVSQIFFWMAVNLGIVLGKPRTVNPVVVLADA